MEKKISKIYNRILYLGIDYSIQNPYKNDRIVVVNQHLIVLVAIFLFYSLCSYYMMGLEMLAYFLFGISSLFFIVLFFFSYLKSKTFGILFFYVLLCFFITYYTLFFGLETGAFLFYFPLLSSIFTLFSWSSNKTTIIFLFILVFVNFYFIALSHFYLSHENELTKELNKVLFLLNISCILVLEAFISYIIYTKNKPHIFNLNFEKPVDNINYIDIDPNGFKKKVNRDVFSEDIVTELVESISLTDTIFVEKFNFYFPEFCNRLHNISQKSLSVSDIKMCALLKLGLSTKQIAIYTNSTIKSVEGKIYRLRKKLGVSPQDDSRYWFSRI